MFQVFKQELIIKYNGLHPLPREEWEIEEVSKSVGYLTRAGAESWISRNAPKDKDTYILKIPGEPAVQKQTCEKCGKRLPHYIEVIADDGYVHYSCPRCGYDQ